MSTKLFGSKIDFFDFFDFFFFFHLLISENKNGQITTVNIARSVGLADILAYY